MESKLYICPRCEKSVKSTSGLTKYVNAYKIPITLPSCQPLEPTVILEDNMTNRPDLPSNNNEESISPEASNHTKEGTRLVGNNNKDIRLADIDQQRPTTPN